MFSKYILIMLLNGIFYLFTIQILVTYVNSSEGTIIKTSSIEEQILDFIKGDEEIPESTASLIELYSKAIKSRESEIEKLKSVLLAKDIKLTNLRYQAKECFPRTSSCSPFGNSSKTHEIYAPGMDYLFDVRCWAGWIVIQQRVNGKENFNRNWTEYREGFGSFQEDFFLGLEKIHRLTSSHRHELQLIMKDKDGASIYANYDRFEVSGEDDQYRLFSLGNCTGNELGRKDYLREHEHQMFHTYDRDTYNKCVKYQLLEGGGWWMRNDGHCGYCKLNAMFYDGAVEWGTYPGLKKIMMLIRPKIGA